MHLTVFIHAGLEREASFRIVIGIRICARGAQIIAWFKAFVGADAQIGFVFGAKERIKFLGHQDAALGLSAGWRVALKGNFAERRRFPLDQRDGDVTGHHVGAAQLKSCDPSVFLHLIHFYDRHLKIRLAMIVHGRLLTAINLIMICVSHMTDDLVTLAFFHSLAMKKDNVRLARITALVWAVVPGRDEYFVRDLFRG